MAEGVLFDIAGEIIMKLRSRAPQEFGLWLGVPDELRKLYDTISAIQAVLLDAEEKYERDNKIKDWIGKLRDAVYDADDLLDDFSTEALKQPVMTGNKLTKEVRLFFSRSNQVVYGLKMGRKIKAIRERLDAISAEGKDFHFEERLQERPFTSVKRDQTISFVREEEVIGRENDKREIIRLLLDSNDVENVVVISIVGMGGLGKTTLAQFVYNDDEVKINFELRMWVCVSDVFDIKVIVEKMIKSTTNREPENLDLDQLQCKLRDEIDGKKYLLVLDDVWNEDPNKWRELENLLRCGARGSRIIVTTRSQKVSNVASRKDPYVLSALSKDDSWKLFVDIAFHNVEPQNSALIELGKKIVEKYCFGVPLAIKTIGGLLYFQNSESGWLHFLNNELSKIEQKEDDILPTLRLSYNHLPSHLKRCFAYCSLFPKGRELGVEMLIQLWMAQGFIRLSNSSKCLEDVGVEYFMDLLSRSFFQEVRKGKFGHIESCKMHALMHDLATSVAGTESIIFNSDAQGVNEKCRHVSFEIDRIDITQRASILKATKMRTILLQDGSGNLLEEVQFDLICNNFRSLLVLDLHDMAIRIVPGSIYKLKRLRYLDLSENHFEFLPNSITKLQNLKVLKLRSCENLKELPEGFKRLVNLQHLDCYGCFRLRRLPRMIGQLTLLQTITWFVIPGQKHENLRGINELSSFENLRGKPTINFGRASPHAIYSRREYNYSIHLEGNNRTNGADDEETLKKCLQLAALYRDSLQLLNVEGYSGLRFSSCLDPITKLVELSITGCKSRILPPVDQIPSLERLTINFTDIEYILYSEGEGEGEGEGGRSSFFHSLKILNLFTCPNLKGWCKKSNDLYDDTAVTEIAQHPQFPCLSALHIYGCPKLIWMPLFPTLCEMHLTYSSIEPLQETLKMEITIWPSSSISSPSFSLLRPLSRLTSLTISSVHDLESLPEEGLENLISLQELSIYDCPRLTSLPQGMRHLTSLQKLVIYGCPQLEIRNDYGLA